MAGVESWAHGTGCGLDSVRESLMLFQNINSGEAMLFENFRAALLGVSTRNPETCSEGSLSRSANWFEGRIWHSSYGVVDVTTPAHLEGLWSQDNSVRISQAAKNPETGALDAGRLTFSSQLGSSVSVIYENTEDPVEYSTTNNSVSPALQVVVVEIEQATQDNSTISVPANQIMLGHARDLSDPTRFSEADQTVAFDMAVTISASTFNAGPGSSSLTVQLSHNSTKGGWPNYRTVQLDVSGDAFLSGSQNYYHSCVRTTEVTSRVICFFRPNAGSYDTGGDLPELVTAGITVYSSEPGPYTVTARILDNGLDANAENDESSITVNVFKLNN